ncbi:MAG: betaine/proline/choline family ABC transporter ATP-binding protein [Clostridiaceae bacterium]|jgi:osmoprotectant transport system ATP-binding protein|nr:betaine/proline/choline family ABC transporter ATP-binding protein [Clostridiaceae bacterium]
MIRFEEVVKKYGDAVILDQISFEIKEGEFAVLIGPSGCGKTTTLKTINRLIEPEAGRIYVEGKDIMDANPVQLRRKIGYVIQEIGLFPNMTVAQNIAVVPKRLKYSKEEIEQITRDLLDMVNMSYEEYAHKYPSELSGGQQQRIGVLRALAASPPIVLMDEPFGALDPMTRNVLQDEIIRLHKKLKKTIVFVTHDMDEALKLADTIIFMDQGKIVQMAGPDEMLENPASDLIKQFMGKRLSENGVNSLTAADFMKSHPASAYRSDGVKKSTQIMARRQIDTLLIKNEDETYAGSVTIGNIRKFGKQAQTIGEIPVTPNAVSYTKDDAADSFEKLLDSDSDFVVVLHDNDTIAGIVTKTSMARAMADALWGDES